MTNERDFNDKCDYFGKRRKSHLSLDITNPLYLKEFYIRPKTP